MKGVIDLRSVHLTYPFRAGSVDALSDVSFLAREGEFFSIVGPSGCGKSTLIKIIAGLLPTTKGEVRVDGNLVKGPHPNVGMVFQEATLLAWRSVLKNIMLQIEVRKEYNTKEYIPKAMDLIKIAGLDGFEDRYPWELSGGMQQRVSFCRALIHDPPLLLMDEPFGALDAMTRDEMNVWLQDTWMEKAKTILFITHDISEAVFLSDRIMVMTARPGTVKEIMQIDLPRPRQIKITEDIKFVKYVSHARRLMHAEGYY